MTTRHYAITTIVALFASLLIGVILSLSSPVYAGGYTEQVTLVNNAGTVQSSHIAPNVPMINNELYTVKVKLSCVVCPATLPPTSGEITLTESILYMVYDALHAIVSQLFS